MLVKPGLVIGLDRIDDRIDTPAPDHVDDAHEIAGHIVAGHAVHETRVVAHEIQYARLLARASMEADLHTADVEQKTLLEDELEKLGFAAFQFAAFLDPVLDLLEHGAALDGFAVDEIVPSFQTDDVAGADAHELARILDDPAGMVHMQVRLQAAHEFHDFGSHGRLPQATTQTVQSLAEWMILVETLPKRNSSALETPRRPTTAVP